MAEEAQDEPKLFSVVLGVWRGRRAARLVALAGPDVLLTAALMHLILSVVVLEAGLWQGVPVFEDREYLHLLPLLPLLLFVSIWSSSNAVVFGFKGQRQVHRLFYLAAGGCSLYCQTLALMGLVLHLPMGPDAGAVVNGVLLLLGFLWVALFLYRRWVILLEVPKLWAGILCFPAALLILPGSVYLWLAIFGFDKLGWDPFFYL